MSKKYGTLAIGRRPGEKLIITQSDGTLIELFVSEITGNTVRMSVRAPVDVAVDREEVYLRKQKEKQQQ